MEFAYAAKFARAREGGYTVTFRDFPEIVTEGEDIADAMVMASDALGVAITERIEDGKPVPPPSPPRSRERLAAVPSRVAAKAALYCALAGAGISRNELARRIGGQSLQVRRLLDTRRSSNLDRIDTALAKVGKRLVIGLKDAS